MHVRFHTCGKWLYIFGSVDPDVSRIVVPWSSRDIQPILTLNIKTLRFFETSGTAYQQHSITSQKILIFNTAMRTFDLMHLHRKHACNISVLNIQVRCSLTHKRQITVHGAAISPHALCGRTLCHTLRGGCEVWCPSPRCPWSILSSGVWRLAVWYKVIVLREPAVSIFGVVCKKRKQAVITSEKTVTFVRPHGVVLKKKII